MGKEVAPGSHGRFVARYQAKSGPETIVPLNQNNAAQPMNRAARRQQAHQDAKAKSIAKYIEKREAEAQAIVVSDVEMELLHSVVAKDFPAFLEALEENPSETTQKIGNTLAWLDGFIKKNDFTPYTIDINSENKTNSLVLLPTNWDRNNKTQNARLKFDELDKSLQEKYIAAFDNVRIIKSSNQTFCDIHMENNEIIVSSDVLPLPLQQKLRWEEGQEKMKFSTQFSLEDLKSLYRNLNIPLEEYPIKERKQRLKRYEERLNENGSYIRTHDEQEHKYVITFEGKRLDSLKVNADKIKILGAENNELALERLLGKNARNADRAFCEVVLAPLVDLVKNTQALYPQKSSNVVWMVMAGISSVTALLFAGCARSKKLNLAPLQDIAEKNAARQEPKEFDAFLNTSCEYKRNNGDKVTGTLENVLEHMGKQMATLIEHQQEVVKQAKGDKKDVEKVRKNTFDAVQSARSQVLKPGQTEVDGFKAVNVLRAAIGKMDIIKNKNGKGANGIARNKNIEEVRDLGLDAHSICMNREVYLEMNHIGNKGVVRGR